MKILDAIKIARLRFNRASWLGYYGNGWQTNHKGWRKVVRNTKLVCEKHGITLKDFDL